jgi:hypothetical protein
MPGGYEISTRRAVFLGAALGGFLWAMVFVGVVAYRSGQVQESFLTSPVVAVVIVISGVIVFLGSWLVFVSRTAGRTFGLALIVCALSGWVVFGTVAIQSWLWRQ